MTTGKTALLALAAAALAASMAAAQDRVEIVPDEARDALKERWRGWTLADVSADATGCRTDEPGPPSVAHGDFDGDGMEDLAVLIQTADGIKTVALLRRLEDYDVHELDTAPGPRAAAFLTVIPAGRQYVDSSSNLTTFLVAPTLASRACTGPAVAYVWGGYRFTKTAIQVRPAAPAATADRSARH